MGVGQNRVDSSLLRVLPMRTTTITTTATTVTTTTTTTTATITMTTTTTQGASRICHCVKNITCRAKQDLS